jgi:hypothetical protein
MATCDISVTRPCDPRARTGTGFNLTRVYFPTPHCSVNYRPLPHPHKPPYNHPFAIMNADDQHPHSIAFHYALTTMEAKGKDGERSGYSTCTSTSPTRAYR